MKNVLGRARTLKHQVLIKEGELLCSYFLMMTMSLREEN